MLNNHQKKPLIEDIKKKILIMIAQIGVYLINNFILQLNQKIFFKILLLIQKKVFIIQYF